MKTKKIMLDLPLKHAQALEWLSENVEGFDRSQAVAEMIHYQLGQNEQLPESQRRKFAPDFHREDADRSVDFSAEVLPEMKVEARILQNQNFQILMRFDGTGDGFIRLSDAVIWMNAMKVMIEEVRAAVNELRFEETKAKKSKK